MNSEATLAAVKVRLRKKRIGSIGAAARSSQRTNSARTAAPASRAETTSIDSQPADTAPGAERDTAAIRRHRSREDRQRERQHDRAAEPLDRAGRDQLVR